MADIDQAVRFGLIIDSDNGVHVRFRLFAASGGQHLGLCGQLVMRTEEFAAFYPLLPNWPGEVPT